MEIYVEYSANTKRSSRDQWDPVAKQLVVAIQRGFVIVYLDSKKDAEKWFQAWTKEVRGQIEVSMK